MSELIRITSPGAPVYFGREGDPLVIVLPDGYGRLPALGEFAGELASEGTRVAALDLYGGVATLDDDDAECLMTGIDTAEALEAIDEVIGSARRQGSTRFAIVGFGIGGRLALLHAQGGQADAVVAYYASLSPAEHGVLPQPLLLHYAEHDAWAPEEDPDAFVERLADDGTPVERHSYFDTVHSFANLAIESRANRRAARLAQARTVAFLRDTLGPSTGSGT